MGRVRKVSEPHYVQVSGLRFDARSVNYGDGGSNEQETEFYVLLDGHHYLETGSPEARDFVLKRLDQINEVEVIDWGRFKDKMAQAAREASADMEHAQNLTSWLND